MNQLLITDFNNYHLVLAIDKKVKSFVPISGITRIRELKYGTEAKLCNQVIGYDANALYLYSMMQDMPTGIVVTMKPEDNFKPTLSTTLWLSSFQW